MRVRLVEDNPDLTMLMAHILDLPDVELETTDHDFSVLLDPVCWEGIDVALVDVLLGEPEMDGRSVLAYLAQDHPHIRRVVLSAVGNVYPELGDLAHVVLTKGGISAASLFTALGLDRND